MRQSDETVWIALRVFFNEMPSHKIPTAGPPVQEVAAPSRGAAPATTTGPAWGPSLQGDGDAAAVAYRDLAPYYDRLTADHDYERWTDTLEPLALLHGLEGRRLLDVACGTGKSFEAFVGRGYDVCACDISPEMAARARERAGGAVDVHVADMRALPVLDAFDLVTCLGDSVNYLTEPADLPAAFASAARNLRPGGLYLFDVNTLLMYRSAFLVDRCADDPGGLFFAWRGARAAPAVAGTLAEATVEVFALDGGLWRREASRHVQRHHPEPLLREALARAGFAHVSAHGQDAGGVVRGAPDEERLTKTVFVARTASETTEQGRR
jgi:SAM-dependent methyltransferase